jgi:hypothetical protein
VTTADEPADRVLRAKEVFRKLPIHDRHVPRLWIVSAIDPVPLVEIPASQQGYAHHLPVSRRQ